MIWLTTAAHRPEHTHTHQPYMGHSFLYILLKAPTPEGNYFRGIFSVCVGASFCLDNGVSCLISGLEQWDRHFYRYKSLLVSEMESKKVQEALESRDPQVSWDPLVCVGRDQKTRCMTFLTVFLLYQSFYPEDRWQPFRGKETPRHPTGFDGFHF